MHRSIPPVHLAVVLAMLAAAAVVSSACLAGEPSRPAAELAADYPRASLPDAPTRQDISLVEARGSRATVIVCMAGDCPISNEFLPTIIEIAKAYSPRGVSFLGLNPNGSQTLDIMAEYASEHGLPFPYLKDAGGKIARKLLFSVTPEARVFDASGKLVYSGRIDDRYRRGGAADPNVAKDLEKALDEVLAGQPVSASRTKAIGCPLQVAEPRSAR